VLITFPIKGPGGSKGLVQGYEKSKGIENSESVRWIQLGSTGIWDVSQTFTPSSDLEESAEWRTELEQGGPTLIGSKIENLSKAKDSAQPPSYSSPSQLKWTDRHSPYDTTNARAIAEDELLSLHRNTFILNLSGLWVSSFSYCHALPSRAC
jgi:hypothetical protein